LKAFITKPGTNKKALLLWAAASLVCMLLIFLSSSQAAEDSSRLSGGLTRLVFGRLWQWFAPNGAEMPETLFGALETGLRKGAHLFAFFVLGICTANTLRHATGNLMRALLISAGWCSVFGIFDELHQHFVPGRACMWQDWLIDTAGALLGIGLVWLIFRRKKKRKQGTAEN